MLAAVEAGRSSTRRPTPALLPTRPVFPADRSNRGRRIAGDLQGNRPTRHHDIGTPGEISGPVMRWSEDTTVKFVGLYKDCECLWNSNNANYRNKNQREAAFMKIANEMSIDGFGVQEAKQKVKNLQSTYSQELRKIENSKKMIGEEGDAYVPSIKWFTMMDSILRNVKKAYKPKMEPCEVTLTDTNNEELDDVPRIFPCEVSVHEFEEEFSAKPKRLKTTNEGTSNGQAFQFMHPSTNTISNRDEFAVYGEHLANRLRNCGRSKLEIAIAQNMIDEVCFKLTMGAYFQESLGFISCTTQQNHSNEEQ